MFINGNTKFACYKQVGILILGISYLIKILTTNDFKLSNIVNWWISEHKFSAKRMEISNKKRIVQLINENNYLMPPPLKRESWSLDDITMFGVAGGARRSAPEEMETLSPVTAVACFAGSESEIIIPFPCSLFSFLPLTLLFVYTTIKTFVSKIKTIKSLKPSTPFNNFTFFGRSRVLL